MVGGQLSSSSAVGCDSASGRERAGSLSRLRWSHGYLVTCRAGLWSVAAGVILESEDLHRRAYNATFDHFNVQCGE